MLRRGSRRAGEVALNRALSKLGISSRAAATRLIRDGRVSVDGQVVRDPLEPVVPERARIDVDGQPARQTRHLTVLLNKPRGVVTTERDPEGRRTVFDLVADSGVRLVSVGRLDWATSGLLLLTTSTRLAAWLTDPANAVPRLYAVIVRGAVSDKVRERLVDAGRLSADDVSIRKRSGRETHLLVRLREGRNREVRRLFDGVGHEVTKLRRVAFGGLELGDVEVGRWRAVSPDELRAAFPGAPITWEE